MVDFLAGLFDQFDPDEQARIRAAKRSIRGILAQGTAAVRDRQLATGSSVVTDWVLEPKDDARADATGVVFLAYVNGLWHQTDPARSESIQEFGAKVERLVAPFLKRYGRAGEGLIANLRWKCQMNAWLVHSELQTSTASAMASTAESTLSLHQSQTDHASEHIKASDTTEQPETERASAAEAPGTSSRCRTILDSFEPWGVRRRRYAELNARGKRIHENWANAKSEENTLNGARAWASLLLKDLVSEVPDVFELKRRITKQTFDKYIKEGSYFWERLPEFASALLEEGYPSLEDHAIVAMAERAESAAKTQSSNERQPGPALDPLAGKGMGALSEMPDQSRLDKIEEILKPHYAEIRDKNVRLPALCECKSETDRTSLAEGLRGRAPVWATEALLAVLTNPDLPPIEPALFDSIVSKLVVRLAKDAADFYSLDNYVWPEMPRADNCKPELIGFPKYRSDILARLMEDLPNIAKEASEVNRRRYLGDWATGEAGGIANDGQPKPRKKRGRPAEISDELKKEALGAKGGAARAKILYQTRYPTPQQVKNVPSILRHYQRSHPNTEG
jgi:hypothetical protein